MGNETFYGDDLTTLYTVKGALFLAQTYNKQLDENKSCLTFKIAGLESHFCFWGQSLRRSLFSFVETLHGNEVGKGKVARDEWPVTGFGAASHADKSLSASPFPVLQLIRACAQVSETSVNMAQFLWPIIDNRELKQRRRRRRGRRQVKKWIYILPTKFAIF